MSTRHCLKPCQQVNDIIVDVNGATLDPGGANSSICDEMNPW